MIKAVLFDLGDTLIHFDQVDLDAAFTEAARDTYDVLADRFNATMPPFKTYHRQQLWALRWAYLKTTVTGREFNSVHVLRRCSKKLGIRVPEDFYDELAWRWYKPLARAAQLDPHAHDALAALRQRGFKLGIISNTFIPGLCHDRHLAETKLIEFFPVRVYSCELGIRKPKKGIFTHALDQLTVRPEQAVFVGNSFRIDILGARRVGLYAVLKSPPPTPKRLDAKTCHIETLDQLPARLEQLAKQCTTETTCQAAL